MSPKFSGDWEPKIAYPVSEGTRTFWQCYVHDNSSVVKDLYLMLLWNSGSLSHRSEVYNSDGASV